MLYLVIFILIFIIILLLLLFLTLKILVEYLRNGKDDHAVISFFLLRGLIKYKYEIPFLDINKKGVKVTEVKEKGKKDKKIAEKRNKLKFRDIVGMLIIFRKFYQQHQSFFTKIKIRLKKKLIIRDLRLDMIAGTGDAYYTSLLNAVLWTLIGVMFSFLSNNLQVSGKCINVKADFNQKRLNIDLYCIFEIKVVHIIVIGFKTLFFYLRFKKEINQLTGGEKNGRTSDSRSNDNSYEQHKGYG